MSEQQERWQPLVIPLLVAVVLVLGAGIIAIVSLDRASEPVAGPTSTAEPTDPAPTPVVDVDVETTTCEEPPELFLVLCEVHALVVNHFVDEVDDDALVAGAILGLEEAVAEAEPGSDLTPPDGPVTCAMPTDAFAAFCDAYAAHLAGHPIDREELLQSAVGAMVAALEDPNTGYVPPEIHALQQEEQTGAVEGIGALVQMVDRDDPDDPETRCRVLSERCILLVVSPIAGGPAEAAGVRAGDRIVSFDGDPVAGETIHEAVSRGRGPAGSQVTVEIERGDERFEIEVTRERFEVPDLEHRMIDDEIGYVRIFQFIEGTQVEFRDAVTEMLDAGAQSFVLDLRNNPGGLTGPTRDVADTLLDGGLVFALEFASGRRSEYTADSGGPLVDGEIEIAVLVNKGTTSAAEILAAALAEHGRALLVGDTTFGKATAQQSFDLPDGGAVRITVARWLTPDGNTVDGVGVEPKHPVDEPTEPGEDPDRTLDEALAILRR